MNRGERQRVGEMAGQILAAQVRLRACLADRVRLGMPALSEEDIDLLGDLVRKGDLAAAQNLLALAIEAVASVHQRR